MRAILIDPVARVVSDAMLDNSRLLEQARMAMGLRPTDGIAANPAGPGMVLLIHAEGLLQPEPQPFWSTRDEGASPMPGRALVIAVHPETGQLMDVPVPVEAVAQNILWREDVELVGIRERWVLVPAQDQSGLTMSIQRMPEFRLRQDTAATSAEGPVQEMDFWIVRRGDDAGRYEAERYNVGSEGMNSTGLTVESPDLEELYDLMGVAEEEGDRRVARRTSDHPSIVETWIVR